MISKLKRQKISLGLLAGIGIALVLFVAFVCVCSVRLPRLGVAYHVPKPFIQCIGEHQVVLASALADQMGALGSDALFLPTKWNYGIEGSSLRAVGNPAQDAYLPEETLLDKVAFVQLWEDELGVVVPADLLAYKLGNAFAGMGGVDTPIHDNTLDLGHYRVYSFAGEAYVHGGVLPQSYDSIMEATLWGPAHFIVHMDSNGFVGAPLMMSASGSEQIDEALKAFVLGKDLQFQLKKGYYRIDFEP